MPINRSGGWIPPKNQCISVRLQVGEIELLRDMVAERVRLSAIPDPKLTHLERKLTTKLTTTRKWWI